MTSPEQDFVSKFLTLATLSEPVLPPNYQKPANEISSLGVALPPLKYKYDPKRAKKSSTDATSITVTCKSIKAPKYTIEHRFSSNDTVYQIKKHLVDKQKADKTENIKLLLKGKVLHDSSLLSDFNAGEVTITVMQSKTDSSKETTPATASPTPAASTVQVPWEDIHTLLQNKLSTASEASHTLQRLKKGWEITE